MDNTRPNPRLLVALDFSIIDKEELLKNSEDFMDFLGKLSAFLTVENVSSIKFSNTEVISYHVSHYVKEGGTSKRVLFPCKLYVDSMLECTFGNPNNGYELLDNVQQTLIKLKNNHEQFRYCDYPFRGKYIIKDLTLAYVETPFSADLCKILPLSYSGNMRSILYNAIEDHPHRQIDIGKEYNVNLAFISFDNLKKLVNDVMKDLNVYYYGDDEIKDLYETI